MWMNKFGIVAINQKSPKDITKGNLSHFKITFYITLIEYITRCIFSQRGRENESPLSDR
jgi:hypothetical protein